MNLEKLRIKHPDKVLFPSPFISSPIHPIPYQPSQVIQMTQQPLPVGHPTMSMRMGSPPQAMRRSQARPLSPNVKFKYQSPHKYSSGHQAFVPIPMGQLPGVRHSGSVLNIREGQSVSSISLQGRNNEIKMNEASISSLKRMQSHTKLVTVGSNTINNYIYLHDQEFNMDNQKESQPMPMGQQREKEEQDKREGDIDEQGGLPVVSDQKIQALEQDGQQLNAKDPNFSTSMNNPPAKHGHNEKAEKTMTTRIKQSDKQLELMMEEYHSLKYKNTDHNNVPLEESNSNQDSLQAPMSTSQVNKSMHQLQQDQKYEQQDQQSFKGMEGEKKEGVVKETAWGSMKGIRIGGSSQVRVDSISQQLIAKNRDIVIEGIQNVRSEVLDDQINFQLSKKSVSNSSAPKYSQPKIFGHEQDAYLRDEVHIGEQITERGDASEKEKSDLEYSADVQKGWEKDLEIKNLKNQIWLMKLKENQLLGTIKRLQKLNKEQQMAILNLSK